MEAGSQAAGVAVSGPWLDAARPVLAALAPDPAYVVGGAVRNALLGEPVADVDIATPALPETVVERAGAAGLRSLPTGLAHGTVTVLSRGQGYEVTTFRRDVETFGRHARVAFAAGLAEDARRRDFTMNALYATADGRVIDPLGGLEDCLARRVRFVGDPRERIGEDALRILRFFRFLAWYGGGAADADALSACRDLAHLLDGLSRERVRAEMLKLLAAPDPRAAIGAMAGAGVLSRVFPGADAAVLLRLVALEAGGADALLRLAALGDGADLRLSRAEARRVAALRSAAGGDVGAGELGYRLGAEDAMAAGRLRAALRAQAIPEHWRAEAEAGARARFPLRAADLPGLSGPAIGRALKAAEAAWIGSGFRLGREALVARFGAA